jgi:ABC-type branched-subunit amino acid transport system permease subunit
MNHEELINKINTLKTNYSVKVFREVIDSIKREKINNDVMLQDLEDLSLKRFREKVRFTVGVPMGNLLEGGATIAVLGMVFLIDSDWMLYISALALMTTLHPLAHYFTGALSGIRFTHYYLNGPAKVEPTLRIDHISYLKASGKQRGFMHLSGVLGTIAAPLIAALIAFNKGSNAVAFNLVILFLLLIVFELLTSTKIGDLMKAKREYGYR